MTSRPDCENRAQHAACARTERPYFENAKHRSRRWSDYNGCYPFSDHLKRKSKMDGWLKVNFLNAKGKYDIEGFINLHNIEAIGHNTEGGYNLYGDRRDAVIATATYDTIMATFDTKIIPECCGREAVVAVRNQASWFERSHGLMPKMPVWEFHRRAIIAWRVTPDGCLPILAGDTPCHFHGDKSLVLILHVDGSVEAPNGRWSDLEAAKTDIEALE
jgi:hypothetical protein